MSSRRLPTALQLLRWMSAELRMSLDDLVVRTDIYAAQAARDAALAVPPRSSRRADVIGVSTALVCSLLRRPPFSPWRRPLAVGAVELTCWMNGCELALSDAERTALLDQGDKRRLDPRAIERWLGSRIKALPPGPAARARVRARAQLGSPYLDRPTLFISTRFSRASEECKDELCDVANKIQDVAEDVARRLRTDVTEISGVESDARDRTVEGAISVSVPWREERWRRTSPSEDYKRPSCEYNRGLLRQANSLVVLAHEGGSHSTGTEVTLVPYDAQVLFLSAFDRDPLPHAIDGNMALRPMTVDRISDWFEAGLAAREFFCSHWLEIERSWALRELRGMVYRPVADSFADLFDVLGPDEIHGRLTAAGLVPGLEAELVDPHALPLLGDDVLRRVEDAFGIAIPLAVGRGASRSLTSAQLDAWGRYQAGLRPTVANYVRSEAERQLALGVLRYSLTEDEDWFRFHAQLAAEAGA